MPGEEWLDLIVADRADVAEGIVSIDLVSATPQQQLPRFEPGAHIDVAVGANLVRQYSLCGDPADADRYRLGVLLEPASRGGSVAIHRGFNRGDRVRAHPPRNTFRLDPAAPHSLLFAGGIGVTPMIAMAHALHSARRSFTLHYCVRSQSRAAFWSELNQAPFGNKVVLHREDDPGLQAFDPVSLLQTVPFGTHAYICGPAGFISAVATAAGSAGYGPDRLHIERFVAQTGGSGSFTVHASRSGIEVEVGPGQTIASALMNAGIDVELSCEAGVCGTCLTRVIEGTPDHRDQFQTEAEKRSGDHITICCSRSHSLRLVVDL